MPANRTPGGSAASSRGIQECNTLPPEPNRGSTDPNRSRIGVLISGRGSNLQALIDADAKRTLGGHLAIVISNKANAAGLDRARAAGLETLVLDHRSFSLRD